MARISKQQLSKSGMFRWAKITISGQITWELPKDATLPGALLVFHFFGDDPGPDPSLHTVGVWVSRGSQSRANTSEYRFRADTKDGADTEFCMKVRRIGDGERRFNKDRERDEIYVTLWLEVPGRDPKILCDKVHTKPVTGWF